MSILLSAVGKSGLINAAGYVAAFCTTAAYVPQVLHVLKLRSAREISYPMLLLLNFGCALWVVYGVYVWSVPLLLCNGITLALAMTILVLKIGWEKKR